jgi:hypothetical protein
MTSSRWSEIAEPSDRQPLDCSADCSADEVHLLLKGPTSSLLTELDRTRTDHFALTLRLTPGAYRYRYYLTRDGVTTYAAPSDHASITMHGFDGLLTVHAPAIEAAQLAREHSHGRS